jgi:hypothetical protein
MRGWTLSIAALLCLPAYSAEAPQPYYVWTCRAETHYGMKVTPDGKVSPLIWPWPDGSNPVVITIRRRADNVWTPPGPGPGPVIERFGGVDTRYTVTVQPGAVPDQSNTFQARPPPPRALKNPYTGRVEQVDPADYVTSGVVPGSDVDPKLPQSDSFGLPADVNAIYWGDFGFNVLTLHPAEKDWVFLAYKGYLLSDAEARLRNIKYGHPPGMPSEANASVEFMTGPCIRETRTMTAN